MWSEGVVYLRTCYTVTVNVATGVDVRKPPSSVLEGIPRSAEI